MVGKALVLVFTVLGLAAGSILNGVPEPCVQRYISLPATETFSNPIQVTPVQVASALPPSVQVAPPPVAQVAPAPVAQVAPVQVASTPAAAVQVAQAPAVTTAQFASFPASENIFAVAAPGSMATLSGFPCEASFPAQLFGGIAVDSSSLVNTPSKNGPGLTALPFIEAPAVTLPAVEEPVVSLSSPAIPAPKVLFQKCICTKTIVKPQVYQRTVTVPKVQRYIKRTVTPVVENVAYKSNPFPQPEVAGSAFVVASGSAPGSASGSASGSGCESDSRTTSVMAPIAPLTPGAASAPRSVPYSLYSSTSLSKYC